MRSGLNGGLRQILSNPTILFIIAGIFLLLAFGHFFSGKPAGLSPDELSAQNSSQSLSVILHHPLNAPHNLLAFGIHKAGAGWRESLRLASAIFGGLFLASFYWLARSMFGKEIGLMGALVLLAAPIFLISARTGGSSVMFLWPAALIAIYTWLARSESVSGLLVFGIFIALAAYTPGLLLWIAAAAILGRKKIVAILESYEPPAIAAASLLLLLLITPLIFALVKDYSLLKPLFLIPPHWPAPLRILKNIAWMILALFIKTPHHDPLIIGRLPLFNMLADALIIFGSFAMWSAAQAKFAILAASIAYAVIAAGFNDSVGLLVLAVPAASIIICAGLRYLYIEWRRVFPLNPVAKTLALSLMWVLVLTQIAYGTRYALIAWPVTTETRSTYVLK